MEGERRTTPHGDRRRQADGRTSRRSQRRSERQSRVSTWLPGILSWWCRRCTAMTALTAPPSPPTQNLKLMKEEEEKERRRKLKALDRRKKAGERLSSPDGDAWREWKSVSLGLPSRKRKRKKRKKCKLPKLSSTRAPRTWKPGHLSSSPSFLFGVCVLPEECKNIGLPGS